MTHIIWVIWPIWYWPYHVAIWVGPNSNFEIYQNVWVADRVHVCWIKYAKQCMHAKFENDGLKILKTLELRSFTTKPRIVPVLLIIIKRKLGTINKNYGFCARLRMEPVLIRNRPLWDRSLSNFACILFCIYIVLHIFTNKHGLHVMDPISNSNILVNLGNFDSELLLGPIIIWSAGLYHILIWCGQMMRSNCIYLSEYWQSVISSLNLSFSLFSSLIRNSLF